MAELESRFHPSKETAARGATGHLPGALSQFIRDVEKFGFRLTWKDLAKVSKTLQSLSKMLVPTPYSITIHVSVFCSALHLCFFKIFFSSVCIRILLRIPDLGIFLLHGLRADEGQEME